MKNISFLVKTFAFATICMVSVSVIAKCYYNAWTIKLDPKMGNDFDVCRGACSKQTGNDTCNYKWNQDGLSDDKGKKVAVITITLPNGSKLPNCCPNCGHDAQMHVFE